MRASPCPSCGKVVVRVYGPRYLCEACYARKPEEKQKKRTIQYCQSCFRYRVGSRMYMCAEDAEAKHGTFDLMKEIVCPTCKRHRKEKIHVQLRGAYPDEAVAFFLTVPQVRTERPKEGHDFFFQGKFRANAFIKSFGKQYELGLKESHTLLGIYDGYKFYRKTVLIRFRPKGG